MDSERLSLGGLGGEDDETMPEDEGSDKTKKRCLQAREHPVPWVFLLGRSSVAKRMVWWILS